MKICHIANINCVHTLEIIRYFQRFEDEIHLISPTLPDFDNLNEKLGHQAILHFVGPIKPGLKNFVNYLKIIREVKLKLTSIKPEILHGHYLTDCGFIGAASGFHPFISFALGSDVLLDPTESFFKNLIYKFVLKNSDVVHCDSAFMQQKMITVCKNPDKVKLVFPYVDLEIFKPQEKNSKLLHNYNLTKRNLIVLSNRSLETLYNIDCLIYSIPDLIIHFPNARFVVMGEGRLRTKLEKLTIDLGLRDYVYFTGFVPHQNLPEYLNLADVYVSTSLSDGTSVSLLEAMACGKAVVVTDIAGNREWIDEGNNGFLFRPKNSKELARKIEILLQDKQLRDDMKKRNCNLISQKVNIDNSMSQILKIYSKFKKSK